MKLIRVGRGLKAKVDDEDFDEVIKYSWWADKNQWTTYARTDQIEGRPRLHNFIMKAKLIHHKNGDGLDNQRDNLVLTNDSINTRMGKQRASKTGYRGVYKHHHKYVAQVTVQYNKFHLGCYATPEEAAMAYNRFVLSTFGSEFPLNEIPNG